MSASRTQNRMKVRRLKLQDFHGNAMKIFKTLCFLTVLSLNANPVPVSETGFGTNNAQTSQSNGPKTEPGKMSSLKLATSSYGLPLKDNSKKCMCGYPAKAKNQKHRL